MFTISTLCCTFPHPKNQLRCSRAINISPMRLDMWMSIVKHSSTIAIRIYLRLEIALRRPIQKQWLQLVSI